MSASRQDPLEELQGSLQSLALAQSPASSPTASPSSKRKDTKTAKKGPKKGPNPLKAKLLARDAQVPAEFRPPAVTLHQNVLILIFADLDSLESSLLRPHVAYEGSQLKGKLKGVNFPTEHLALWLSSLSQSQSQPSQPQSQLPESQPQLSESQPLSSFPPPSHDDQSSQRAPQSTDPAADAGDSPDLGQSPAPFSAAESWILQKVAELQQADTAAPDQIPHYLIASLRGDTSTILHEWAHAQYFLNAHYRQEAERIWADLDGDLQTAVRKELALRNYSDRVTVDEFQAYIVETPSEFGKKFASRLSLAHRALKGLLPPAPAQISQP
ncbi:uncharacterized protein BJ171DRAFT_517111 [Polychytrium aggregatum]|uniref:uncharacterized protein n=1 Tax=Polychytrium aggregatum TaxID=110093 RepID=UPI0022FE2671|nr:uncharacterized protein BJ171DRAFT_517111 [Polychytrium aggregatum]KAI9199802.1 hypothetical protein BJ171DRAFT_517111 [Polychytrium aggregatum]